MPFSFNPDQDYAIKSIESDPLSSNDTVFNHASIKDTDFLGSVFLNTFILLIVVTALLFGYRYYLNDSVNKKQAVVASYEKDLDGLNLDDVKDLSARVSVVKKIVDQFPFATVSFMAINKSVEHGVIYNAFGLLFDDKTGEYRLSLSGAAPDYKTVIQQVDTLKHKPFSDYMKSLEISSVALDTKTGNVNFSLNMIISIKGTVPSPNLFNEDISSTSTPQDFLDKIIPDDFNQSLQDLEEEGYETGNEDINISDTINASVSGTAISNP